MKQIQNRKSLKEPFNKLKHHPQCGIRGSWVEEGRTESVKNTGDPEWQKSFNLKYYFHQKQVRFLLQEYPQFRSLKYHKMFGGQVLWLEMTKALAPPGLSLTISLKYRLLG